MSDPSCTVCGQPCAGSPGTTFCTHQHGACLICGKLRVSCKCFDDESGKEPEVARRMSDDEMCPKCGGTGYPIDSIEKCEACGSTGMMDLTSTLE